MKFLKLLGLAAFAFGVLVAGLIAYVTLALPNVGPAPDLKVEVTPARVARRAPRQSPGPSPVDFPAPTLA